VLIVRSDQFDLVVQITTVTEIHPRLQFGNNCASERSIHSIHPQTHLAGSPNTKQPHPSPVIYPEWALAWP